MERVNTAESEAVSLQIEKRSVPSQGATWSEKLPNEWTPEEAAAFEAATEEERTAGIEHMLELPVADDFDDQFPFSMGKLFA